MRTRPAVRVDSVRWTSRHSRSYISDRALPWCDAVCARLVRLYVEIKIIEIARSGRVGWPVG